MSNFTAPETLFIEITSACNSRCKYCHMWHLADGPGELQTEEKLSIIRDFANINPNGEVVLTGGEPFLKADEVFRIFDLCHSLGLVSSVNTNGIAVSELTQSFFSRGPTYLVISLDSHLPEIHDYHRGIPGAFDSTRTLVSELISQRGIQQLSKTEIIVNTVITKLNIQSLTETLNFLEELGVDGVTLQMLSPTFHRIGRYDKFFETHFFDDKPGAINCLQKVIDEYDKFPLLRTTRSDLFWMQKYIIDPLNTAQPICNSHERNIVVDHIGDARLCFNMSKIMSGEVLGNTRDQTLYELWHSEGSRRARQVMKDCRLSCGMLNCHRSKEV